MRHRRMGHAGETASGEGGIRQGKEVQAGSGHSVVLASMSRHVLRARIYGDRIKLCLGRSGNDVLARVWPGKGLRSVN